MSSKVLQPSSKMLSSKSNLKLGDSTLKSQPDEKDDNFKSPGSRTNAKSNLKTRKLADLLNSCKESSYERQTANNFPEKTKNVQNSPPKARNYMLESFNTPFNPLNSSTSRSPFKIGRDRQITSNANRANRTKNAISPSDSSKRQLNASAMNHSVLNRTLKESNSSQLQIPNTSDHSTRMRANIPPKQHLTDRILERKFLANDQSKVYEEVRHTKKIEKILEPLDGSFEFTPFGKQEFLNTSASRNKIINIVPSNSPRKVANRTSESPEGRQSIEKQLIKPKVSKERKVPLLQYDIPVGKEIIMINNLTVCSTAVTNAERSGLTNSTPSRNRGNVPVLKLQKTRTSSGNLSFEEVNLTKSKETQIEDKIEALLSNKPVDEEHFQEINSFFDAFVEKMPVLSAEREILRHKDVLKKIKLAYEIFFKNYFSNMQRQKEKLSIEKNELSLQNKSLKAQLEEYGEGAKLARENSSCDFPKSTANTQNEQVTRTNQTSTLSELLTANKKHFVDQSESPLMTNKIEFLDHEKETLRTLVTSQQSQINALMKKEIDMIRLAEVCKKKGFDILRIYREEVNKELEGAENCRAEEGSGKGQVPGKFKNRDDMNLTSSQQSSARSASHSGAESVSKDGSSDHLMCEDETRQQKQLDLNPSLKSMLKLDFTILTGNKKPAEMSGLNLNGAKREDPVGFHEEFMARIDEFSLSWRQAAQNERKIP